MSSAAFDDLKTAFDDRFSARLQTVDSHTEGEVTRLVVGGYPPIPGASMREKRDYVEGRLDGFRKLITREPRGHRGILAALVTEPVTDGAAFGLIYMDARRYPYLCGHATIGAVTTLIEGGVVAAAEPETTVIVDTPSGPMSARAAIRRGRVTSVAIRMVPAFAADGPRFLTVPGLGEIPVHLVCSGGFFAMVASDAIDVPLTPAHAPRLAELGMAIIDAANEQLTVFHPTRPEVTTVDVTEFYDTAGHDDRRGKSVVVYGESHIDRSPCGTGTAAKLALLHAQGAIGVGEAFVNESPLGTTFEAVIVSETVVGDRPAVTVEIRGGAHITGFHELVSDPADPFPEGYIL